jgi:hypothetical protein
MPHTQNSVTPALNTQTLVVGADPSRHTLKIANTSDRCTLQVSQEHSRTTNADGNCTISTVGFSSASAALTQVDVGRPITGTGISALTTVATVTSATTGTLSQNAASTQTTSVFTLGNPLTVNLAGNKALRPGDSLLFEDVRAQQAWYCFTDGGGGVASCVADLYT